MFFNAQLIQKGKKTPVATLLCILPFFPILDTIYDSLFIIVVVCIMVFFCSSTQTAYYTVVLLLVGSVVVVALCVVERQI